MTENLFEREEHVLSWAESCLADYSEEKHSFRESFSRITLEYERILKQLKRVTRLSDRTTIDLNAEKQILLDKVNIDALTGLYNRRFMEEKLKYLLRSLSRSQGYLTVMMLDIDYFKKYNDTYGHGRGDECLKAVAKALASSFERADDLVCRYGGEEFTAILPNTDKIGAALLAQRILDNVRDLNIPHEKNDVAPYVTVSIGVTCLIPFHNQQPEQILKRADDALYESKHNGRDRFTFLQYQEG